MEGGSREGGDREGGGREGGGRGGWEEEEGEGRGKEEGRGGKERKVGTIGGTRRKGILPYQITQPEQQLHVLQFDWRVFLSQVYPPLKNLPRPHSTENRAVLLRVTL